MLEDTDDEIRKGNLVNLDYAKLKDKDPMEDFTLLPIGVSNLTRKKDADSEDAPLQEAPAMSEREKEIREINFQYFKNSYRVRSFRTVRL